MIIAITHEDEVRRGGNLITDFTFFYFEERFPNRESTEMFDNRQCMYKVSQITLEANYGEP